MSQSNSIDWTSLMNPSIVVSWDTSDSGSDSDAVPLSIQSRYFITIRARRIEARKWIWMKRDIEESIPIIVVSGKFTAQEPGGMRVGLPKDVRKRESVRRMCQNSNLLRFFSISVSWGVVSGWDWDCDSGAGRCDCCCCWCWLGLSSGVSSMVKYPSTFDIRHAWLNAFQDRSVLQPSRAIEIYRDEGYCYSCLVVFEISSCIPWKELRRDPLGYLGYLPASPH